MEAAPAGWPSGPRATTEAGCCSPTASWPPARGQRRGRGGPGPGSLLLATPPGEGGLTYPGSGGPTGGLGDPAWLCVPLGWRGAQSDLTAPLLGGAAPGWVVEAGQGLGRCYPGGARSLERAMGECGGRDSRERRQKCDRKVKGRMISGD